MPSLQLPNFHVIGSSVLFSDFYSFSAGPLVSRSMYVDCAPGGTAANTRFKYSELVSWDGGKDTLVCVGAFESMPHPMSLSQPIKRLIRTLINAAPPLNNIGSLIRLNIDPELSDQKQFLSQNYLSSNAYSQYRSELDRYLANYLDSILLFFGPSFRIDQNFLYLLSHQINFLYKTAVPSTRRFVYPSGGVSLVKVLPSDLGFNIK